MDKIGIIGLGYVGLPLLWTFHQVGEKVIGFDVDPEKINSINAGKTYIKHFKDEQIQDLSSSDLCEVTTDFSRLDEPDAQLRRY